MNFAQEYKLKHCKLVQEHAREKIGMGMQHKQELLNLNKEYISKDPTCVTISEYNQTNSVQKWDFIIDGLTRAMNGEAFVEIGYEIVIGDDRQVVVERCGFCEQYDECDFCPLNHDDTCNGQPDESLFWKIEDRINRFGDLDKDEQLETIKMCNDMRDRLNRQELE